MQQSGTGRSSGNLRDQPSVSSPALARMLLNHTALPYSPHQTYSLHWMSLSEFETDIDS